LCSTFPVGLSRTVEGSALGGGGGAADEADGVARPLEDEIGDE
jgi:hypothetical protein